MELIHIGRVFYINSGTKMSSLYDIDGNRQDWGFVEIALARGESVHIRPATKSELQPYIQLLKEIENGR